MGADQGQSALAAPLQAAFHRAPAMLPQRLRPGVVDKGQLFLQQGEITRLLEILRRDKGKPEQVVGDLAVQPRLGERVPPVIDRAVHELVPGMEADLIGCAFRIERQPDQTVLELVAKAVGPALLVISGAGPHAAGDGLVFHPGIGEQIESGIGGFDPKGGKTLPPARFDLLQLHPAVGYSTIFRSQIQSLLTIIGGAEDEGQFFLFARCERDGQLQPGDAVTPLALGVLTGAFLYRLRRCQVAENADESLLVALKAGDRCGGGEKGGVRPDHIPVAAFFVGHLPEALARKEELVLLIEFGLDEGFVKFAVVVRREAQIPFEIAEEIDLARQAAFVVKTEVPDLGRVLPGGEEGPVAGDLPEEGGKD